MEEILIAIMEETQTTTMEETLITIMVEILIKTITIIIMEETLMPTMEETLIITITTIIMEETMEVQEMLVLLSVQQILMIMVLEFVSAKLDLLKLMVNVSQELHVKPIKLELLMEAVVASQDLPTIMEFALNVLLEPSGVLPQTNVSSFVDKTQLTMRMPRNVFVLKDLD